MGTSGNNTIVMFVQYRDYLTNAVFKGAFHWNIFFLSRILYRLFYENFILYLCVISFFSLKLNSQVGKITLVHNMESLIFLIIKELAETLNVDYIE